MLNVNSVSVVNNTLNPNLNNQKVTFGNRQSMSKPIVDTVEIQGKTNTSKKKKTAIGIALALVAGVGIYCLTKGKIKTKALAEHIDFREAKTIEEAIEFGKTHLGIKNYKGFKSEDLEVINWINEGIVNTSNKLKGKVKVPRKVVYGTKENAETPAYIIRGFNRLHINRNYINKLDSDLKEITKLNEWSFQSIFNYFDKESIENIERSLDKYKKGEMTSLKDKLKLKEDLLAMFEYLEEDPILKIRKILNDKTARQKLIDKGILIGEKHDKIKLSTGAITDLNNENLFNLDPRERYYIAEKLKSKSGCKAHIGEKNSFAILYHELGHLQHKSFGGRSDATGKLEIYEKIKNWQNKEDFETALSLSNYAATSPGEFVAEAFSNLMQGVEIGDDARALYKKLGGIDIF